MRYKVFSLLMVGLFALFSVGSRTRIKTKYVYLPSESKGCIYPVKEVKEVKTEMKHILPYTLIHKCHYDGGNRLIKVSTYNLEVGYQLKKPTHEVLFHWAGGILRSFSRREATHGNGEVDVSVVYLKR